MGKKKSRDPGGDPGGALAAEPQRRKKKQRKESSIAALTGSMPALPTPTVVRDDTGVIHPRATAGQSARQFSSVQGRIHSALQKARVAEPALPALPLLVVLQVCQQQVTLTRNS